jgi:hypothetical protein
MHTVTFRGIVNVEKIYCDFSSCDFFSTDTTNTYDNILNTDTISILIRKLFRINEIKFLMSVTGLHNKATY